MLIFVSLLLILGLFFFGQRTNTQNQPSMKDAQTMSSSPKAASIDFERLSINLQQKLDSLQKDSLQLLTTVWKESQTPNDKVSALNNLAYYWERLGYVEMAANYYQKSAQVDSIAKNWKRAGDKLGLAFRIAGDSSLRSYFLENAISAYQNAKQLDTANLETQIDLASCYIDGYPNQPNLLMQGVMSLLDISRKDSLNIRANLILGRMSIVSGQYDKALNRLNIVTTHDPSNEEGFYYLGELYAVQGEKEKAKEAFNKCKKLTKNPTFAKDLDRIIQSL